VKLASRITGIADPGTILASSELRRASASYAWTAAGTRNLKGIAEEIEVYRLEPGHPGA